MRRTVLVDSYSSCVRTTTSVSTRLRIRFGSISTDRSHHASQGLYFHPARLSEICQFHKQAQSRMASRDCAASNPTIVCSTSISMDTSKDGKQSGSQEEITSDSPESKLAIFKHKGKNTNFLLQMQSIWGRTINPMRMPS